MKERLKKFFLGLKFRRKTNKIDGKKFRLKFKHVFFFFFFSGLTVVAAGVIWVLVVILPDLPDVNNIENLVSPESSVIMDREGNVLYTLYGDENRDTVELENISQHAIDAIIAMEDDEFYEHIGVDFLAIGRAGLSEFGIGSPRGGSTLTQQFVRNAVKEVGNERSYERKIKEIILALQLETIHDKDTILEFYLNRVGYGSSIYGIETASQNFFGKPASELTIAEGAILAAIPNRPTYFWPYGDHKHTTVNLTGGEVFDLNLETEQDIFNYNSDLIVQGLLGKTIVFNKTDYAEEGQAEDVQVDGEEIVGNTEAESGSEFQGETREIYVKGRADLVLNRMFALGYITQEERDAAVEEIKTLEFKQLIEEIKHPHFVFYVRSQLEEKYGPEQIEMGGLRITTTLDPNLQEVAQNIVSSRAETNLNQFDANNAALVSMDTNTGEILTMVGSVDYFNEEIDGNVNVVTVATRSPGSSWKPFTYAAAFLHGNIGPETVFYDLKTKFGGYEPNNYDGSFSGPVTVRAALGRSLNIPAVKALEVAGVQNLIDMSRDLGFEFKLADEEYGLSLSLGATETGPLQMVSAYSTFANGGYRVEPVSILKVVDRYGNILEEFTPPEKTIVLDPQVAFLINDILSDVSARPAGFWRNSLSIPGQINAAKTGTSNEKDYTTGIIYPKDTWTVGYFRDFATAVWVGNTDGRHMNTAATGLGAASPIWKEFMTEAAKDREVVEFDKPSEISVLPVSRKSGKLATQYTPKGDIVSGYFPSFSSPLEDDSSHYIIVNVDNVSGKLATQDTPIATTERRSYYIHKAYLSDNEAWQRPVTAWARGREELPPTEPDDVHTPENMKLKPGIIIGSPGPNAVISPPQLTVSAVVSESNEPISDVSFYFDGNLVGTATSAPYSISIPISMDLPTGSIHNIKAVVTDRISRSSENTIQVEIGEDEVGPEVNLLKPESTYVFPPDALVPVQATARDSAGVAKLSFYIDDYLIQSFNSGPYSSQVNLPSEPGKYVIKAVATDHAGNQTIDSTTVTVRGSDNNGSNENSNNDQTDTQNDNQSGNNTIDEQATEEDPVEPETQ